MLLPNWEAPLSSSSQQQPVPSNHNSRRLPSGPSSQEQRLQQLLHQVDALVQELSAAPVFTALVTLFVPGFISRTTGIQYVNETLTLHLVLGGTTILAANAWILARPPANPSRVQPSTAAP